MGNYVGGAKRDRSPHIKFQFKINYLYTYQYVSGTLMGYVAWYAGVFLWQKE